MTAPLGYLDSKGAYVYCARCIGPWEGQPLAEMLEFEEVVPVYEGDRYFPSFPPHVKPGQVCAYPGCGRVLLEVEE